MGRLNVLLIVVDDLRCDTGTYTSNGVVKTPVLDHLATQSVQFQGAYAQQALCGPSRASMLTGKSPDSLRYWAIGNRTMEEVSLRRIKSMPRWFARRGYTTFGTGKLFHTKSTSRRHFQNYVFHDVELHDAENCGPSPGIGNLVCHSSLDRDEDYVDYHVASTAVSWLEELSNTQSHSPWFMAVGFRRPHVRFRVPRRFLSMYPEQDITVASAKSADESIPSLAVNMCENLSVYNELAGRKIRPHGTPLPDQIARLIRRGYYAAVSWVDSQIGRVLQALERSGFKDSTFLVVTSDHGWQLGEHGCWCKSSNFELATRVPLWVRDPRKPDSFGRKETSLVELMDLFPTLVEMEQQQENAPPSFSTSLHGFEGKSLLPLLSGNANDSLRNEWKAAFSEYPRCPSNLKGPGCTNARSSEIEFMGYSVRTKDWRYTEWRKWAASDRSADWTQLGLVARELYYEPDAETFDPDQSEIANRIESFPEQAAALAEVVKLKFFLKESFASRRDVFLTAPSDSAQVLFPGGLTDISSGRVLFFIGALILITAVVGRKLLP